MLVRSANQSWILQRKHIHHRQQPDAMWFSKHFMLWDPELFTQRAQTDQSFSSSFCLEATQPYPHSTKLQLRHWSSSSSRPSRVRTTLFLPAHVEVTIKTWNTDSFPSLDTKAFFNFDEMLLPLNITVFSVLFFLNFYYLNFIFFSTSFITAPSTVMDWCSFLHLGLTGREI